MLLSARILENLRERERERERACLMLRGIAPKLFGRRGSLYHGRLVEKHPLIVKADRNPLLQRNLFLSTYCVDAGHSRNALHPSSWSLPMKALHSQAAPGNTRIHHAYEDHEPADTHTHHDCEDAEMFDTHHAHEDHELQVASLLLQNYLQNTSKFALSDAAAVVGHAPSFLKCLVAAAKQKSEGAVLVAKEESGSMFQNQVQAFLNSTGVDALKPVLESIGITCEQFKNVLVQLSVESVDLQCLLSLIRTFEKLGVSRSSIGSVIQKEVKVLSYTSDEIKTGFHALKGFGIPDDEVLDLIRRYPLILGTDFVNNIASLDEELSIFSSKNFIIRKAICSSPQHVHSYTRGCAKEVVEYLKSFNFTTARLNRILQKYARIVLTDVEKKLKHNVQFLEDLGASKELIAKVINRCPNFFFYSVEDNLMAKLEYFKTLAFDEDEFCNLTARNPNIFSASLENKIKPAVAELRTLGLTREGLKKVVLYRPALFGYKLGGAISTIVKDLSQTSYPEDKKVTAFIKLYSRGAEHKKKCEDCLVQYGLSAAEAKQVLEKEPGILGYNEQALTVKLESLTKTFGIPIQSVLTVPEYLSFGLRKRVQRRQRVLSYMKSKGLLTAPLTLKQLVLHSNTHFYNDFVKAHSEDQELSKIWFRDRDNGCGMVGTGG